MRFLQRRRQAHPPIELNVIPLIDVVFFLLIFYVISTSFSLQETTVPIQRPASSQATTVNGGFVPVAIVKSGVIQIGSQVVDIEGVPDALRIALDAAATAKVVVIPDREVPSGLLLQVMDACSAAGAESIDVAATRDGG